MLIIFPPRREWPDRILKKKAAHSQTPWSHEIIESLLQVHHIHVDILASLCWQGIPQAQLSVLFVALETHNHQIFIERSILKVVTLLNMSSVTRRSQAQHLCFKRHMNEKISSEEMPVLCSEIECMYSEIGSSLFHYPQFLAYMCI